MIVYSDMRTPRLRLTQASSTLALALGLLMLVLSAVNGDLDPIAGTLVLVGVLLLCWASCMAAISRTSRRSSDAFDEGYEAGFDKGWREGRSLEVLRLVKMRRRGDGDAMDGTAS